MSAAPTNVRDVRLIRWGKAVERSNEGDLLEYARAGDREAFGALVRHYWPRLLRWLRGCTGQLAVAEDLAQEVFLKAWTHLPTMKGDADHFRAWLYRIAAHALLDWRRRQGAQQRLLATWSGSRTQADVENSVAGKELYERIWQAVRRLPVEYRMALLLRVQEELSFREIGEFLGIPEETARWRVFRARALLLRQVGAWLDDEDCEVAVCRPAQQAKSAEAKAREQV
ncbi:MAG: RNA polymerase sigma factor [Gemmatales bacterium]|nr:RNA polymerase sigma factor [Gemmatales bacterium]MDW7995906.1 RNA polymerase sigma factor [Gemmatales bacterium]